jgi:hypothetical protein
MYSSIYIIRVTKSRRINRQNMWHVWGRRKGRELMEKTTWKTWARVNLKMDHPGIV